ncbi:unnamed protein product [Moneuplotes crassus]|uniref:Uncharacterized protein n=1 Tax=Euplotes crassus TaxID=5936 RepID=A0AAD1Y4R7_EUPCR|nr:unnamed protein product [Moneuplotes crassus]
MLLKILNKFFQKPAFPSTVSLYTRSWLLLLFHEEEWLSNHNTLQLFLHSLFLRCRSSCHLPQYRRYTSLSYDRLRCTLISYLDLQSGQFGISQKP